MEHNASVLASAGFGQEFNGAGLDSANRHGDVTVTCEKNDGNINLRLGEFPLKVRSAQIRKPDVEDQASWHIRTFGTQELSSRAEGLGFEAHRPHQSPESRADSGFIVHDEDQGTIFAHTATPE